MSNKIIYPADEIWASNGDRKKPTPERFLEGNITALTKLDAPKASDRNYMQNRNDTNIRAILQEGITAYSPNEIYPIYGLCVGPDGSIYQSQVDNNQNKTLADLMYWKGYINPIQWPVNSVLERADGKTPMSLGYPGVWEAMESNVSSTSCQPSDEDVGAILGINDAEVPLLEHSHDRGTMEITGRFQGRLQSGSSVGAFSAGGSFASNMAVGSGTGERVAFSASKTWSGRTSEEGTSNPTINVQGRRIKLVKWIRTS